ncbi:radical SAM family heme chaperone HemW [Flavobacterium sp. HSC-61S13]|uniref:radical SAM family heme chaperone HemW n=1 Tax=Flavobacterium sp. HSC-61S13 TaxID=2910963 RepID=UPI00209F084C|nr:radical SAM family heme chaperone HemW [Flavobacterium sp. HSC-61S13]MCP1995370.1 oxygen-independent coproporphyrinogen-3 oxidase [Flavobacterium sp. HSC-61S13]
MAGIYIHIPFCKQACYYCDFHFSTSLKKKDEMIVAILDELLMRRSEVGEEPIETIYFGGGTPSLLEASELNRILAFIADHFEVIEHPEITLEANPDDLNADALQKLAQTRINRLSIGIQSFYEADLKMMNRAHNADEALNCLVEATKYFKNISIDLIYGIPGMTEARWLQNIETVLSLGIPHISSYALTVEPKTALYKMIQTGSIPKPDDGVAHQHFLLLMDRLKEAGFIHYELSNFGKEGYFSQNNSAYWLGKKYLGVGPSAHSFDGQSRSWNIANNALYIKSILDKKLPIEREVLSEADRYNEYVMTGLRTIWGVDLARVENDFGVRFRSYVVAQSERFIADGLMSNDVGILTITNKGKFLSDGIAADLFWLNLK